MLSNIWATFVTNFVPKSFKTLPNLVTHTIIILIQPLKWFFSLTLLPHLHFPRLCRYRRRTSLAH